MNATDPSAGTAPVLVAFVGGAFLAAVPPALLAQQQPVLEEIVVTGSRIARDEFSSPAPISVFSADDFTNSGVVTIDEFLRDVPAFTGFTLGTTTNNGNIGVKMVDLRGLGTKRTLVLINGRRQVGSFIGGNDDVGWSFADSIAVNVEGTYLGGYEEAFPLSGTAERAGTIQYQQVYPEWKLNTAFSVQGRNWSATWASRYISSMDDYLRPANLTDDAVAESIWYQDIYATIDVGDFFTITVGLDNITDEDPPQFHSNFNAETEPGYYDVIGRRFFTTITARF